MPQPSVTDRVESALLHRLPLMASLLERRGIQSPEEAERFLKPSYTADSHDPFLMKDMARAVERVLEAIDRDQSVLIYSDFDADGVPGAVVLHDFFREIGFNNFTHYIPHRHDEGFGVHLDAVDQFQKDGVDLIITIDCGIADTAEVDRAREHGIDIIVTDHHEPNGQAPAATAVLDPKQPDCQYPFSELCGAGVIFKLVQAILATRRFGLAEGREKWLLDMVGLATLSDMVPLRGENRVLASFGLVVLRRSRRPGLLRLLRELRIDQRFLTEDDIGFMIAPRINAASRMGVPMDAFKFLSTTDPTEAEQAALHLNSVNEERKGVVAAMVKQIKQRLGEASRETASKEVIVAGDPAWRPSLLGLAANTLAAEYDRPVFLWGRDGQEILKGSARSNGRVDLLKLMEAAKEVLTAYGGHRQAGGFTVDHECVHSLEEALIRAAAAVPEEDLGSTEGGGADAELTLEEVGPDLYRHLEQLAPFGVGNPKPLFRFRRVAVEKVRSFGRRNDHLELSFRDRDGRIVKAVGFFMSVSDFPAELKDGRTITLEASMERSVFAGKKEIRLRIVKVQIP